MKARNAVVALVVGVASSIGSGTASAGLRVNGDFATGDLTGWTASALDQHGNPVPPLRPVASSGGLHFGGCAPRAFATAPSDRSPSPSSPGTASAPSLSAP